MNESSVDIMSDTSGTTSREMPSVSADDWGFWVNFITTPIIVLIGVIGNTLSIIVMKSKTLRNKSYSHYLCALAVFDSLTLVLRLLTIINEYLERLPINNFFHSFSDIGCKIYRYTEHVAYLMSSWLVVLMAVERLTAVWFPFRKMAIRTQSGAAVAIVCLLILVCLSQVFCLEMIEHIPDSRSCAASDEYIAIYTSLDIYFYQWTLTFLLPVVTVLVCNSLVIYQIVRVSGEVKSGAKELRHNRAVRRKHHTTRMLLTVSFTFIITLSPLLLLNVSLDVSIRRHTRDFFNTYLYLQPYVQLAMAFSLVNYAVNFFIYVLSGKCFRYELGQIFHRDRSTRRSFTARSTRAEVIQL